jgi:hypothetical protein
MTLTESPPLAPLADPALQPAPAIRAPFPAGPVYLVLCDYGSGIGFAINEAVPGRCDWESTVRMIAAGEWDCVRQVLKIEPGGIWRDVSELARQAVRLQCQADETEYPRFAE